MRDAARAHTEEAIEVLVQLLRSGKQEVRVQAARELLDRAWGRPTVAVTGDPEGEALRLQLEAGGGELLARLRALAGVAVLEPVPPANGSESHTEPELTSGPPSASPLPAASVSAMSPAGTPEAGQIEGAEGGAP